MKTATRGERFRKYSGAFGIAAVCAALTLGAAACGSSSSSSDSSSGGSSSSGSPVATANQSFVKEHSTYEQANLGPTTPATAKPATGKSIVYMDCGAPVCHLIGTGIKEATDMVGWKLTTIVVGATPEAISNDWNRAVQLNPDGVIATGYNSVLFKKQLAQLAAKGIPYVSANTTDSQGGGITAVVNGPPGYVKRGDWLARWAIADASGKANVLYVTTPAFPAAAPSLAGLKTRMATCPDCSLKVLNVSPADTDIASKVVSTLQSNPDINELVFYYGDLSLGVPQALAGVGLTSKVHIITASPESTNLASVKAGQETSAVAEPDYVSGFWMVDAIIKALGNQTVDESQYSTEPFQYMNKDNIGDPQQPYIGQTDYKSYFTTLWKLG
jgi:ABC-type sugar transport system substrate-binding protein